MNNSMISKSVFVIVEEALRSLDRYRLFGRELEVEFARGDRKSRLILFRLRSNECLNSTIGNESSRKRITS